MLKELDRNKILVKNISWGIVYKGLGMIAMFLVIPVLFKYLGEEKYGIWAVVLSILNWFVFFDFGIGSGLKNRLTEALSLNNIKQGKQIISTALFLIILISVSAFILASFVHFFFDLRTFMGLDTLIDKENFNKIVCTMILFLIFSLVTNIFKHLYSAVQETRIVQFAIFVVQSLFYVLALLMNFYLEASLLGVIIVYCAINLTTTLLLCYTFFRKRKYLFPSIKSVDIGYSKQILGLGFNFFLMNFCIPFIISFNNIFIIRSVGAADVAVYDTVFKSFQLFPVAFTMISTPLWPMYINAIAQKDIKWIKKTMKMLNRVFLLFFIVSVLFFLLYDYIIQLWMGDLIKVSFTLKSVFFIYVIIRMYGEMYICFINASGKIKLIRNTFIYGVIANIVLVYFFVNYLDMGISGVILATSISLFPTAVVCPIMTKRILKRIKA